MEKKKKKESINFTFYFFYCTSAHFALFCAQFGRYKKEEKNADIQRALSLQAICVYNKIAD